MTRIKNMEQGRLDMKRITSWKNYDIVFCPLCNKDAQLTEPIDGFNACTKCGRFGFVIKGKRASQKKQKSTQLKKVVPISY